MIMVNLLSKKPRAEQALASSHVVHSVLRRLN